MRKPIAVLAGVLLVAPWVSAANLRVAPESFTVALYSGSTVNETVNVTWLGDTAVAANITTSVAANQTNTTGFTATPIPNRTILDPGETTDVEIQLSTRLGLVPDTFTVNISAATTYPVKTETETVTDTDTETVVETETVEQVRWKNTTQVVYRNRTEYVDVPANQSRVEQLQQNVTRLQETIQEQQETIQRLRNQSTVKTVTRTVTRTVTQVVTQVVTQLIPLPFGQLTAVPR